MTVDLHSVLRGEGLVRLSGWWYVHMMHRGSSCPSNKYRRPHVTV